MNTGFLGPAVATVLTVYGIEISTFDSHVNPPRVATVLTVYGIEINSQFAAGKKELVLRLQQCLPFTVLKLFDTSIQLDYRIVATVLTVYGIETLNHLYH